MSLQHTDINVNNVVCAFDLNAGKQLNWQTIEVLPLQQEQIEEGITSNIKLLDELERKNLNDLKIKRTIVLDTNVEEDAESGGVAGCTTANLLGKTKASYDFNLEDYRDLKIRVENIINIAIKYPGFESLMKNIAKGNISFDMHVIDSSSHKTSDLLNITYFMEGKEQRQFSSVLDLVIKKASISEEIEQILQEQSKENIVSVSLSSKVRNTIGEEVNLLLINSKEIDEKNTKKAIKMFFVKTAKFTNIVNSFLTNFCASKQIKAVVVSVLYNRHVAYESFMGILFALLELNKIIEEAAKIDRESKFTLFYDCDDEYSTILSILFEISKKYLV
jgi:hypothetical protein